VVTLPYSNHGYINPGTGGAFTIASLTFSGGAYTGQLQIEQSFTVGDLTIAAGRTIALLGTTSRTITVTGTVTMTGSPGSLITITRAGASGNLTFSKSSGTVSCDYLSVSNSIATGGASWYAGANSTDGGGNTGWIFTAPPGASNLLCKGRIL
jgi:hypothetical protein